MIDSLYGEGAALRLLEALEVPGHPSPVLRAWLGGTTVAPGEHLVVTVDWRNGAWLEAVVAVEHPELWTFTALCARRGDEESTGLYRHLAAHVRPWLAAHGVERVAIKPADEVAAVKLLRYADWSEIGGWRVAFV